MENEEAIQAAAIELGITLPENNYSFWHNILIEKINQLLLHDFEKLVGILYRIDVNEKKLKQLLEGNAGQDAAPLIADLIIERQLQKIESRKRYHTDGPKDDAEKW